MGLEDFASDNSENNKGSSSMREYVRITKEEFDDFMDRFDGEIVEADSDGANELRKFTYEYIYEVPLDADDDALCLRVFSTIDGRTDKARDKGADAIRTVIWDKYLALPIGGRKKTLRIKTWRKNLKGKIKDLKANWDEHVTQCDECDPGWLVKREGEYGEFLGCTQYPRCDNTRDIDD